MYALNRVQLIGHLSQDPEIKQTSTGQSVGDISLVTKYLFKDSSGQSQEGSAFHNIVVWRGLADVCGQYLRKGSQVYFSGRLQTDSWEDEAGQKRYKTRIIADEMIMLDNRNQPAEAIPAQADVSGALNQADIIGNLTRDPELRQTPNGAVVVSFSVATNSSWRDKNGEMQERTEFHNMVAWGSLAESINKYLQKGRKIFVSGRLQTRSWETPDGKKKYATEIVADKVLGLGTPGDGAEVPPAAREPVAVKKEPGDVSPEMVPEINYESDVKPEDLPF